MAVFIIDIYTINVHALAHTHTQHEHIYNVSVSIIYNVIDFGECEAGSPPGAPHHQHPQLIAARPPAVRRVSLASPRCAPFGPAHCDEFRTLVT